MITKSLICSVSSNMANELADLKKTQNLTISLILEPHPHSTLWTLEVQRTCVRRNV